MVVLDKKCFKLPYVDGQTYRELMRLGLQYDRTQRTYNAENLNPANFESTMTLLSRILRDKVSFSQAAEAESKTGRAVQKCMVCGKAFSCDECRYFELCETKNIPSICVCGECLEEGKPAQ